MNKVVLKNVKATNCGGNGFSIGRSVNVELVDCQAIGNKGHGFEFDSNSNIEGNNLISKYNRGDGFKVHTTGSLMKDIGFEKDYDPKEVAKLIHQLRLLGLQSQREILSSKSFIKKYAPHVRNITEFTANILAIVYSEPGRFIAKLLEG